MTQIYFQAHRGSVEEAPENTMSAYHHAWRFRGAIPETDVRTTADGHLVSIHDATLARTTDADATIKDVNVADLTLDEIRDWDAGVRFDPSFAGEKVPMLSEVFSSLMAQPGRRLYLEPKAADLNQLKWFITRHGCLERLLFVHYSPEFLAEIQERFPYNQTMSWISGTPTDIQRKFEAMAATNFAGLSQLQLHLHSIQTDPKIIYAFDAEYLGYVKNRLEAAGVDLQLCPFEVDAESLGSLVAQNIRWFVTDAPEAFSHYLFKNITNKGTTND